MNEGHTVAIITGTLPFQKYFCVEMSRRQNIVAILHPGSRAKSTLSRVDRLKRKIRQRGFLRLVSDQFAAHPYIAASRKHGYLSHLLHHFGRWNDSKLFGWSRAVASAEANQIYFRDASEQFNQTVSKLSRTMEDINSDETIATLSELNPDVVICLGGPLYRQPLLDCCKLILGYHTGISPLYNGTGTIYWCFANGHIHLSGATLMVMSPVIDGGDVLAHYLPPIDATDDPERLFAKCVLGSISIYDNFLNHYWSTGSFARVPQPRPLSYYRGHQWNVTQNLAIEKLIDSGRVGEFKRDEAVYEYWGAASDEDARLQLKARVTDLMFQN